MPPIEFLTFMRFTILLITLKVIPCTGHDIDRKTVGPVDGEIR